MCAQQMVGGITFGGCLIHAPTLRAAYPHCKGYGIILDTFFARPYPLGMNIHKAAPDEALDIIIKKAGGVTSLAAALGLTEGAIRYWQKKGAVPRGAARLVSFEVRDRFGIEVDAEVLSGVAK